MDDFRYRKPGLDIEFPRPVRVAYLGDWPNHAVMARIRFRVRLLSNKHQYLASASSGLLTNNSNEEGGHLM